MQKVNLDGRTIIVTGAAGGIGAEYVRAIAATGARVIAADIDEEGAKRSSEAARGEGGEVTPVGVDIADSASCDAMAAASCSTYGGIDGLVNNAALFHSMKTEGLATGDLDYYLKVIDINMHGALRCIRACYSSMAERGGGSIVNQTSTAAWMPGGAYGIAKLGLNGLTRDLSVELGGMKIRVNGIAPGPTDTSAIRSVVPSEVIDALVSQSAMKRRGEPADLVGTLLFLLSDASEMMTGQILTVDGGYLFRV